MTNLIIAAIAAIALFGAGVWTGTEWEQGQEAKREKVAQAAKDAALQAAAAEIAKVDVRYVTINRKLEKEVHEKTVYRDCRHSPDALRLLNDALENREPAGDSKLPADAREPAG